MVGQKTLTDYSCHKTLLDTLPCMKLKQRGYKILYQWTKTTNTKNTKKLLFYPGSFSLN